MFEEIETEWGKGKIVGRTENGYVVCIKKKDMTTTHPDYKGGPCVNFFYDTPSINKS